MTCSKLHLICTQTRARIQFSLALWMLFSPLLTEVLFLPVAHAPSALPPRPSPSPPPICLPLLWASLHSAPAHPSVTPKSKPLPCLCAPSPLPTCPQGWGHCRAHFPGEGLWLISRQEGPDAPKIYFCMQHQSALGLDTAASSPVGGRAIFMMSSTSMQGWWSKTWPVTCNPSELSLCLVITPLICTCLSVFLYVSCLDLERVACHPSLPVTPKGQPLLSSASLGSIRGSTVQGRGGLRPSQGRATPSDLVREHLQA